MVTRQRPVVRGARVGLRNGVAGPMGTERVYKNDKNVKKVRTNTSCPLQTSPGNQLLAEGFNNNYDILRRSRTIIRVMGFVGVVHHQTSDANVGVFAHDPLDRRCGWPSRLRACERCEPC